MDNLETELLKKEIERQRDRIDLLYVLIVVLLIGVGFIIYKMWNYIPLLDDMQKTYDSVKDMITNW